MRFLTGDQWWAALEEQRIDDRKQHHLSRRKQLVYLERKGVDRCGSVSVAGLDGRPDGD
jgi:hypothetical protein